MLFRHEEQLEEQTRELIEELEDAAKKMILATGDSTLSILEGLDVESGAAIGACMQIYKKSKNLAVTQARIMDNMVSRLDELMELNKKLMEQHKEMENLLNQNLMRK